MTFCHLLASTPGSEEIGLTTLVVVLGVIVVLKELVALLVNKLVEKNSKNGSSIKSIRNNDEHFYQYVKSYIDKYGSVLDRLYEIHCGPGAYTSNGVPKWYVSEAIKDAILKNCSEIQELNRNLNKQIEFDRDILNKILDVRVKNTQRLRAIDNTEKVKDE